MRLDGRHVRRIVQIGLISPVPGLPLPAEGVALADDRVVVVVRLGSSFGAGLAVLYEVNESQIALVGADPSGFSDDGNAPRYDVETMFSRIESTVWAARAARRRTGWSGGRP